MDTAQSKRLDLGAKAVGFLEALVASGIINAADHPVTSATVAKLVAEYEATFEVNGLTDEHSVQRCAISGAARTTPTACPPTATVPA